MPRKMIAEIASLELDRPYSPDQIYRAIKKCGLSYKREVRFGPFRIRETTTPPEWSNSTWRDKYFAPAAPLSMTIEDRKMVRKLQRQRPKGSPVWKRYEILLLAADGVPNSTIQKGVRVSRPTILKWRDKYKKSGLDGFTDYPSGRGHPQKKLLRVKSFGLPSASASFRYTTELQLIHPARLRWGILRHVMSPATKSASQRAQRSQRAPATTPEPYSFRLPMDTQRDPYFGATRTYWNERILGENPPVESFVAKQRGAKRGIRFILFASAKRYFEDLRRQDKVA